MTDLPADFFTRPVSEVDPEEAEMSRRHNDANVLTLAGNRLSEEEAAPIVDRFLETSFDGGELPGTPSTVIDLRAYEPEGAWTVLREGAMAADAVATVLR